MRCHRRPHLASLGGAASRLGTAALLAAALLAAAPAPAARAERGAAYIRVQVKPFGRCSLGGASARTAPYRQRVPAGRHELLCRSGHVALAALIRTPHGAVRDLVFDLTRAPGEVTGEGVVRSYTPKAGVPVGTLVVAAKGPGSGAPGVRCAVEGGRLRPAPLEDQLLPGKVSVVCQRGAKTLRAEIRVRRSERVEATFDFSAGRVHFKRPPPPARRKGKAHPAPAAPTKPPATP